MPSIWKQDANGAEARLGRVAAAQVGDTLTALAAKEMAKGRLISPNGIGGFTVFRKGRPYRIYWPSYESGSHDERSGAHTKAAD